MMTALEIRENVPLHTFTSWRVGGPARYFVEPTSLASLKEALAWAQERGLAIFVLGKGSNVLISDEGFDGLVIRMTDKMGAVRVEGETLVAEAGCATSALVRTGAEQDRGGIEFITTVPGTVGGTVFMNAGAHGASVSDFLVSATILLPDGTVLEQTNEELGFRYRYSNLRERGAVVLSATFRTIEKPKAEIQKEVSDLSKWRRERQPQGLSAGSVFTNPPQGAAGKLIEEAGCKGLVVGRAQVSPVHANFFVNTGGATAHDLLTLIETVQHKVYEKHGVWLHPEVRGVGCEVGAPHPESGR